MWLRCMDLPELTQHEVSQLHTQIIQHQSDRQPGVAVRVVAECEQLGSLEAPQGLTCTVKCLPSGSAPAPRTSL